MMPTGCITADVLARILDGDDDINVRDHCSRCARCAEKIRVAFEVAAAGASESSITTAREETVRLTAELLAEPAHRWPLLAREHPYASEDIARSLYTTARSTQNDDRRRAFHISEAASVAAEAAMRAGAGDAARIVLADALKLSAFLLHELGRVTMAFDALDRADVALAAVPHAMNEQARLKYARACILGSVDVWQPDDAEALIADCRETWALTGNAASTRDALELLAIIRVRRGDPAGALEILLPLLTAATTPDARREQVLRNVATSLLRLGDIDSARRFADDALRIDLQNGARLDAARCRWLLGLIAIEQGRYLDALPELVEARTVFRAHADIDSELRVGVDIITARLGEEPLEDVTDECSRLVERSLDLDRRERNRSRAFTVEAMHFIREQASRHALTAADARSVSVFLATNADTPRPVPFVPPIAPHVM